MRLRFHARRKPLWLAVVLLPQVYLSAQSVAQTDSADPAVRDAVEPAVREENLRELSEAQPVKPWQPGDPIRVVPDLKSDDGTTITESEAGSQAESQDPAVREPVKPETVETDLDELPTVEPHEPGDPVREVDDLKLDEDVEKEDVEKEDAEKEDAE